MTEIELLEHKRYQKETREEIKFLIEILEKTKDEVVKKEIRYQIKHHLLMAQPKLIVNYEAKNYMEEMIG